MEPECEKELKYVRGLLLDMVRQHCDDRIDGRTVPGRYFSGFISVNAEAIVYLDSVGLLKLDYPAEGRIAHATEIVGQGG